MVGLACLHVEKSLGALTGPFTQLLIGAMVLITGTYLLSFAFSRFAMLEHVHVLKLALIERQAQIENRKTAGVADPATKREKRRESRKDKATASGRADAKEPEPQA